MIHAFQLLFIECDYPKALLLLIILDAIIFYIMFADFYRQSYKKNQVGLLITGILVL